MSRAQPVGRSPKRSRRRIGWPLVLGLLAIAVPLNLVLGVELAANRRVLGALEQAVERRELRWTSSDQCRPQPVIEPDEASNFAVLRSGVAGSSLDEQPAARPRDGVSRTALEHGVERRSRWERYPAPARRPALRLRVVGAYPEHSTQPQTDILPHSVVRH